MNDSDNIYPVNLTTEHDIKDNGNSIMKSRDDGSVLIDGENAIKISININSSNILNSFESIANQKTQTKTVLRRWEKDANIR